MPIITVGLSHRTAPIEVRESVSIDETELPTTLCRIHALASIKEVAILSTCNRLEVYAVAEDVQQGWRAIEDFFQQRVENAKVDVNPHLYYYAERSAATHLMQVTCGLDSLILGEPQILGQVSNTLNEAQQAGTIGAVLQRLFNGAIHGGKRARAETDISRYTTSISHAAVLLAAAHVPDLNHANVLVVGAGEMANLAIKALHNRNVQHIGCVNRTYTRAAALVQAIAGKAFNWYNLDQALIWADVVIAATGAPHTVIHKEEVVEILPRRQGRPLVFVDIALPRDIEDGVDQLANVYRYDIDDLRTTLDANLAQREAARPAVDAIIDQEFAAFSQWYNSRQAVPTLVEMRRKVQAIAQSELEEALTQLSGLSEREEEIVRRMVHRLVNKVLHEPTIQLKAAAAESPDMGQDYVEAVCTLFDLAPSPDVQATPKEPASQPTVEVKPAHAHHKREASRCRAPGSTSHVETARKAYAHLWPGNG
jgi:glutamyl-tRNA reductase